MGRPEDFEAQDTEAICLILAQQAKNIFSSRNPREQHIPILPRRLVEEDCIEMQMTKFLAVYVVDWPITLG